MKKGKEYLLPCMSFHTILCHTLPQRASLTVPQPLSIHPSIHPSFYSVSNLVSQSSKTLHHWFSHLQTVVSLLNLTGCFHVPLTRLPQKKPLETTLLHLPLMLLSLLIHAAVSAAHDKAEPRFSQRRKNFN